MTTPRISIKARGDRSAWELYYFCPLANKRRRRLFRGTRREAERAAANWERDLAEQSPTKDCSWEIARTRFVRQHLAESPRNTSDAYLGAFRAFEKRIGKPLRMSLVGSSTLADLVERMRDEGLSTSRQAGVIRHLRVFFNWCVRMEIIARAPLYRMVSAGKRAGVKKSSAKGSPINVSEFARMLKAVRQVVGKPSARLWRRYLRGLWLSGLRRDESIKLSWDAGPVQVDLSGDYPAIVWGERGQKNQNQGRTVIAPDFAAWLARTPAARRRGPVFPLRPNGSQPERTNVSRIVAEIGRASGVVSAVSGKSPTAHDLRRSFGTRWALKVPPAALCALMRHSDIGTTMRYYVDLQVTGEIGRLLYPERESKKREKRREK